MTDTVNLVSTKSDDKTIDVTFNKDQANEHVTTFSKQRVAKQLNQRMREHSPDHVWENLSDEEFMAYVTSYVTRATERELVPLDSNFDQGGSFLSRDHILTVHISPIKETLLA